MIVPDVNLLVYAYNSDAPHHLAAKRWWEESVRGLQTVGLPWVVALGFVRIMTSRTVMARPLDPATAVRHVRSWLDQHSVFIVQPGPRHINILAGFAEAGVLTSPVLTDAHLAAIAVEHQAVVHTNDADFTRFPGLRWENPLAPR